MRAGDLSSMKKHPKRSKLRRQSVPLSPQKRRVFTIAAVLLPILLLGLVELSLRVGGYGGDDRLFVSIPDAQSPYFGVNPQIGRRYFSRLDFSPTPRKDLFLKKKPANGFRIFVLGGSSAAGFPYGNNITFPRILHRRLQDAFPDKKIEVINTAMTAINSFTLLDFMDEILAQQPDLLLIYAGHNEFYGALGVASVESLGRSRRLVLASLKLREFRLYLLFRNGLRSLKKQVASTQAIDDPAQTVMARIVGHREIPYQSRRYRQGVGWFQANMDAILKKANKTGTPVILSELVSNVRDQQPFVSIRTNNHPSAAEVFRQAQDLEARGAVDEAKRLYDQAKDLDALRFRAPEAINEVLRHLAERYALPLVPMKQAFEEKSPAGIIGRSLMTEHLHPNIDGYFLMAEAFLQEIRRGNNLSGDWEQTEKRPAGWYRDHWGYTPLDSVYAAMTVAHLKSGWPFQPPSQTNRYFETLRSQRQEEMIVRDILQKGNKTLEQGHLQLAEYFEKSGQYERAFYEYLALTYTVPYLDLFYQPMIEMLMTQRQYQRALAVLYDALKYQDTAFVYKWIGQIYLVTDQTQRGLSFMEEALKRDPNDPQTVYNTCRGYYNLGDLPQGDRWFFKFQSLVQNAPEISDLQRLRQAVALQAPTQ